MDRKDTPGPSVRAAAPKDRPLTVGIRFSVEERRFLEEKAAESGMTISQVARRLILGKPSPAADSGKLTDSSVRRQALQSAQSLRASMTRLSESFASYVSAYRENPSFDADIVASLRGMLADIREGVDGCRTSLTELVGAIDPEPLPPLAPEPAAAPITVEGERVEVTILTEYLNMEKIIIQGVLHEDARTFVSQKTGRDCMSLVVTVAKKGPNGTRRTYYEVVKRTDETLLPLLKNGTGVVVVGDFDQSTSVRDGKTYVNNRIMADTITLASASDAPKEEL